MSAKPTIAITGGDFNGIGPEVALKSVTSTAVRRICNPVLVGSLEVFAAYARLLKVPIMLKEVGTFPSEFPPGTTPVFNIRKYESPALRPGTISRFAGRIAAESIEKAVALTQRRTVDAVVTAPVSKQAMHLAGYDFPGQTEMLAELTGSKKVIMILVGGKLRVGLATVHIPIRSIGSQLSQRVIREKLQLLNRALKTDFAIRTPTIAVLGLNPHAGEGGHIGTEEKQRLLPALQRARSAHIHADGPFPADGFWGTHAYRRYDAILAMYHDQGLIPLKMLSFESGVNFSAGLPIVRTSPDHGTAFDIAGKGIANPSSTIEAVKLAVAVVNNRKRTGRKN